MQFSTPREEEYQTLLVTKILDIIYYCIYHLYCIIVFIIVFQVLRYFNLFHFIKFSSFVYVFVQLHVFYRKVSLSKKYINIIFNV